MIKNNQHKYSISAMCKVLQIPRSTYYYEAKERATKDDMMSDVIDLFQASRQNYRIRKSKVELKKRGLIVSRRRIGRIMQEQGLVSTYTLAKFKSHTKSCNESEQKNRAFGTGGRNGGGCKRCNIIRIHGTLGYVRPINYKLEHLKKVV